MFPWAQYLPPHDGLLPPFLALISLVSVLNSVQAYATVKYTAQVYEGQPKSKSDAYPGTTSPVTPLSSRTFGTWTVVSSIVRLYGAYHIDNPQVYQLTLWTFVIAAAHFNIEWLVTGTCRFGKGLAGPLAVSTVGITWMLAQWGYYVK